MYYIIYLLVIEFFTHSSEHFSFYVLEHGHNHLLALHLYSLVVSVFSGPICIRLM